jgi:tRNA(adenine34) deaminase
MEHVRSEDVARMQSALREASFALGKGEVPVGAVLAVDGTIIARTHNQRESLKDPTAHAEVIAIREAAAFLGTWRLIGATLYVTLEPCAMCIGAAILARVQRVVFGAKDPKAGACGSVLNIPAETALNHRVEVMGEVLGPASLALLQQFFRSLRQKVRPEAPREAGEVREWPIRAVSKTVVP